MIALFKEINKSYANWYNNKTQRKAAKFLYETYGIAEVQIMLVQTIPQNKDSQFFPNITTPAQLVDKWASVENFLARKKQGGFINNNASSDKVMTKSDSYWEVPESRKKAEELMRKIMGKK